VSRRCGLQGPPAAKLARAKQNSSKSRAGFPCAQRPFYLFNVQKLNSWICRSGFSLLNLPLLLVGWSRRSACGVSSSWGGSTDRATFHASLAGTGQALVRQPLVLPQQSGYVPCYLFPSLSQLTGAMKNRETKMTLFHPKLCCWQPSVYFPPPATLYRWFLLIKINRSLASLGKNCLLFHLNSFLQILTSFPFWLASAGSCPPPQAPFSTNTVAEQPGNLPTAQFWHMICDLCETGTERQKNARPAS